MVLENIEYVPTLAIRASEMNGLEFLPAATKDRMVPCILLAPWANSLTLSRSITRLERAFPSRSYFLDIDYDYEISNFESGPQRELFELKDHRNGYENWCRFVSEFENVIPCIQTKRLDATSILRQIAYLQNLGKPYCFRFHRNRFPENLDEILAALSRSGTADFAVIVEGGWTRDPLTLSAWFSGVIAQSLATLDVTVPIVISCTSAPKMFSDFSSRTPMEVTFSNRTLTAQIARGSNRSKIVYGDWGSTRPREESGFASRPLDRVDYPTKDSWYISRNKELKWSFRDAAKSIVESDFWNGDLGIWGEEMIEKTTINEELGIDTPPKNVAARVNIHLHLQSFYNAGRIDPSSLDEDWED